MREQISRFRMKKAVFFKEKCRKSKNDIAIDIGDNIK
jgi:hypothetical protein